ncbi:hypothetical protein F383_17843 [Gossypium arboreum]|uniref:Uncharacterized protein n=1 Tax=Gossypium arboreum TaxID=29729 RepID=A0A0B0NTP2_GOSAR|nr:hypothetical protein F383_17843 [Gossypium arboreum]
MNPTFEMDQSAFLE